MKTTIKFNTQRAYGPKGQRIAARLLDNGSTVFVDVDRNIEGVIPVLCDAEFTESIFNYRWVMESYDSNWYAQPQEEHAETIRELRDLILTPAAPAPAEPEPTPATPAPYATMKSTGERVQVLAPYKKGFLVFVDGWVHNVEVSANDLILDAPAAPVLTDAEPVQTEMEFDDGVEAHDYVVTGCHDEDNIEPEPAAPKTKRPAKYKLDVARDVDVDGGGFSGPETYMLHLPFGFRFTSEIVHTRGFDTMKELRAAAKQDVIPCDCASCAAKE